MNASPGALAERPALDALLVEICEGDQLIVWKLDRLSRSLRHFVNLVHDLKQRGVEVIFLSGDKTKEEFWAYHAEMPWPAVPPDSSATVGMKSQKAQAKSETPGVMVPGQRAMVGERMPPSYSERFRPR